MHALQVLSRMVNGRLYEAGCTIVQIELPSNNFGGFFSANWLQCACLGVVMESLNTQGSMRIMHFGVMVFEESNHEIVVHCESFVSVEICLLCFAAVVDCGLVCEVD